MAKLKMTAAVTSQVQMAEGIYDLRLAAGEIAAQAVPGQFVSLYSKDGSRLLPRPISLCGIDKEKGELRLVYRVAGAGTKEFSALTAGDTIDVLGPLGNGFPLLEGKKAFLIGGGIGIPPMLQLAKALNEINGSEMVQSVIGYRDSHMFLKEEFEAYGLVTVATEDGSVGTKGNVLDAIREKAEDKLSDGNYYAGCKKYIAGVRKQLDTSLSYRLSLYLPQKLLISLGVAAAAVIAMMFQAKSKMTVDSRTYTRNHNFNVRRREDRFINTTVVTRHIESSSSSGSSSGGGGGGNSGSSGGHF